MEELEKYRERCRNLENQSISACACLEWIEMILNNEEVGDFALSFSVVRRVHDLKKGNE